MSFEGADSHLDPSGLVVFSGKILLKSDGSFDESLDNSKNPTRFCRGTQVTLDVADSTGTLRRHPRGALRILSPKYDIQKRELELGVGDLISLMRFKEPTNSVEFDRYLVGQSTNADGSTDYKDPVLDYLAGADRPLGFIVSTLLSRAGISGYAGSLPNVIYNNPLRLDGSYLDSVGKLLYANNSFGWIDGNEIFQIRTADISPGSAITLTIGENEIWYKRLDGSEAPVEVVKATGTGYYIYSTAFLDDEDEQYAAASTIDPKAGNQPIVVLKTKKIQKWDKQSHKLKITTVSEKPVGLVIPKSLQAPFGSQFSLMISEVKIETFFYENKLSCKLKSKTTESYQPRGTYLAEYIQARPNTIADYTSLKLVKLTTENYTYNEKDQLFKLNTTTQEIQMIILNGTDEDWTTGWLLPPEDLVTSELKSEQWKEKSKGIWEYRINTFQSLVRVKSELVTNPDGGTNKPFTNKLNLIYASGDDKQSNSGQLLPAAAERCPADVRLEEAFLQEKAYFQDPCPTVLRQRERTYQVDYLAGTLVPVGTTSASTSLLATARQQLRAIAQREGRLLWGRYKGQEIAAPMMDAIFNYCPLYPVQAIEPDGFNYYYLADGTAWHITQRIYWGCDGIWVGTGIASGGGITQHYSEPIFATSGTGIGSTGRFYTYSLQSLIVSSLGGSGTGGTGNFVIGLPPGLHWSSLTLNQWNTLTLEQWKYLSSN